ncbi:4'-phosphopantetheinyl transferase [Silvimonas terrae]|uniref:4'-phosphopantetheinyl transferase n=1 Tax=Silvimonas terrae TaxID=300266 RepID=A0A840RIV3_9NEIS|nr:4'-phosphopantetheinyl transferase superfamily protein [Silvimonas terrae]MBB5192172.1 4'-phosphopantetheinyl transferase [Silvimonas terrae]
MPVVTIALFQDIHTLPDDALLALPWSDATRARLAQISHVPRQRQLMLGRLLLLHIARTVASPALQLADLIEREEASPCFAGWPTLAMSISHTASWLGVAVAHAAGLQLGLDLEQARPRKVLALARHACDEADLAWVASADAASQSERFYRLWTLREAAYKGGLRQHVYGAPAMHEYVTNPQPSHHGGLLPDQLYWAVSCNTAVDVRFVRPELAL